MEPTSVYEVIPVQVLMVSILVLYVGLFLDRRVRFLRENYIPPAVSGGLLCSGLVAAIYVLAGTEIDFDMQIRDLLLLVFFSTIGLSAKLRTLGTGGRALAVLTCVAAAFLVIQNVAGVATVMALGGAPGYGLMGGSVSFAGGHGTAIAWGREAEAAGLTGAAAVGIAFATFGLIAGGVLGGPTARFLIRRHGLETGGTVPAHEDRGRDRDDGTAGSQFNILTALLVLAVCVSLGDSVNRYLFEKGVLLPGFLASMAVGIAITNIADLVRADINPRTVAKFGEVALSLFLAMSLMSMKLWTLAGAAGPILVVLMVQMLVITLVVVLLVFRVMGRDYDACVISAGFVGMGLGATPVAIANMEAVTRRFGPSPKAFLVVPLVGAFFIDVLNAATIKYFIGIIGALSG